MKKYSFFIFLLWFMQAQSALHAQQSRSYWLYGSVEGFIGTYTGFSYQFIYTNQQQTSFAAGISSGWRPSPLVPAGYISSFDLPITLRSLLRGDETIDNFTHLHALAGKAFNFTKNGKVRLNMLSGLSLGLFREAVNWQEKPMGFLDGNYRYDLQYHFRPSIMIQPKLEFAFDEHYGLSFSPLAQFNTHRSYYGFTVGLMVGNLR